MLSINTHFNPFRMSLKEKAPVQLAIELKNKGAKEKMLSLSLSLTRELSLNKSGIVNNVTKRIDCLKPGESKLFYFDIFPKAMTRLGEKPVMLDVIEHYRDFSFVEREHRKKLPLKVE